MTVCHRVEPSPSYQTGSKNRRTGDFDCASEKVPSTRGNYVKKDELSISPKMSNVDS